MAWETVGGSRLANEFRRRAIHYLQSNGVEVHGTPRSSALFTMLYCCPIDIRSLPKTRREKYRFYINVLPPAASAAKTENKKSFYTSREWRSVRYIALADANGCCQCCGNRASRGNPLHVDHIKPRSKYPELELEPSNLQVLCADCNLGKSNKDQTDWRCHEYSIARMPVQ